MRPHFPLAKIMLWPAVPQRVQIVTGLGRFMRLDSTFYHLNRFVGERAARFHLHVVMGIGGSIENGGRSDCRQTDAPRGRYPIHWLQPIRRNLTEF